MAKTQTRSQDATNLLLLSTEELLTRFADYNPREHSDEDVEWTAASMLEVGWATTICLNQETGLIVGGHGRTLAAEFLRAQTQEWFDLKFKEWLSIDELRAAVAEKNQPRFTPSFWNQCPCITIAVDDKTERSTNIRLNNTTREGKSDPGKVAAMLAQLSTPQQDHAGFDRKTAQGFIDAFLSKSQVETPPEYEPKEYFQRADATVYNSAGEVVDPEDVADLDEIPDDWTVKTDEGTFSAKDIEDQYDAPDPTYAIALDDLDLDNLDESEFRCASVDKDIAETRIVLLVSKNDLEEYRLKIGHIAEWLQVSKEGSAKKWRPQGVMATIRMAYAQAVSEIGEPVDPTAEVEEDGESED
jgi:hypothetical protein